MSARLGMIAGAGELPQMIARQAQEEGYPLPVVALSPQVAAQLAPYSGTVAQYGPGQLAKILRALHQFGVQRVVIIGKIEKQLLFQNPRVDLRMLQLLSRVRDYRDVTLWQALVAEFAREGIDVVEQSAVLGHLLTPAGVLGRRRPSPREWADIRFGFAQAKQLVALDIGQTVVVRHGTVLAVEALEGTDATIRRGCQYGRRGAVVVKVGRPCQDMRFDVPTVGPQTLGELIAGGARVLAVEVGTTLMVRLPELIATANAHRITLVGVSPALLQQHAATERA